MMNFPIVGYTIAWRFKGNLVSLSKITNKRQAEISLQQQLSVYKKGKDFIGTVEPLCFASNVNDKEIVEIDRDKRIVLEMHRQVTTYRIIKQWCDTCGFPEPLNPECDALFNAIKILFDENNGNLE